MKIIDVANPQRVNRNPDKTVTLLSSGNFVEYGVAVKRVEMRLYIEGSDPKLGPYSLITVLVQTDIGEIESTYDEGYRGDDALEHTSQFVLNNLGLSGIILRSVITLKEETKQNNVKSN